MAIVWWDLDGVLALWDDGIDEIATQSGAHLRGFPLKHQRTEFGFMNNKTPEETQVILEIMNHPDLYRNLQPDMKAVEAYKAVEAAGHTNMFASTPWVGNSTCMQDKSDFVADLFGDDARRRLVLTHDKTTLRGDVLVDDKPELHGQFEHDLDFVHFIPTQPYNKHVDTPYRINDWEEDLPTFLRALDNIHVHKALNKQMSLLYKGEASYA